jgi:hypothetical protein
MQVPSLSRGCEIAQFFVRYMGVGVATMPPERYGEKIHGRSSVKNVHENRR